MILKQVIKYTNANAIEATWVDQIITPATGIEGDEDYKPEQIAETNQLCKAYADVQMGMFRDDVAQYGGDIAQYEVLIAEVEVAIVPYIPPPPVIPSVITMRQARLALLGAGLLDTVNAGISTMPQADQIEGEFAATVDRSSPLVATLATSLGLDSGVLDALFTAGAGL